MIDYFKTYFLIVILMIMAGVNATFGQSKNYKTSIKQILKANSNKLDTIDQLIIVYNEISTDTNAVLVTLEKNKKHKWKRKSKFIVVGMGKNGFALSNEKIEGDGKSPTGLFQLGQLFCYNSNVKTQVPYTQTTKEDKWIDDPTSDDYNKYVRGETNAKTYEKLLLRSDAYKYCLVIEYNTHPVVKGKGSAIFFHLGKGATSGCIVIDEKKMRKILQQLSPQKNPCILMGNKGNLISGL